MRHRFLLAIALSAAAAVWVAGVSAQDQDTVSVALLLGRAAWYVDDFMTQFSNVVAEESYVQDATMPLPALTPGRGSALSSGLLLNQIRHRRLKADFLLVRVQTGYDWVPFRDVFEVDGIPVRDRESRLTKLLLQPSPDAYVQANRIRDESARYNLGNMRRTINNPVLPLAVLQGSTQGRFRFSMNRRDPSTRKGVYVVDFKEEATPTIIEGRPGIDLFASGSLWIEAESGTVFKAEMALDQPGLHARTQTTYKRDSRFEIAVPDQMEEHYTMVNGSQLTALATYGRFRRFDVSVDERLQK